MNLYNLDDLYRVDNIIKNLDNPSLYLYSNIITINNNLNDSSRSIHTRYFIKYYPDIIQEQNLNSMKSILHLYPLTYDIIKDCLFYMKHIHRIKILLDRFRNMYGTRIFWEHNITYKINILKNLKNKILALFDGSKSNLYLHTKLKEYEISESNVYHIDIMVERLVTVFKLFKYNFFLTNKILVITITSFLDMKFPEMVEYTQYIFLKIIKIVNNYITLFQLSEIYRIQLDNLTTPTINREVKIETVSSDIDDEDVNFIIQEV